jgi:hypothetical protein
MTSGAGIVAASGSGRRDRRPAPVRDRRLRRGSTRTSTGCSPRWAGDVQLRRLEAALNATPADVVPRRRRRSHAILTLTAGGRSRYEEVEAEPGLPSGSTAMAARTGAPERAQPGHSALRRRPQPGRRTMGGEDARWQGTGGPDGRASSRPIPSGARADRPHRIGRSSRWWTKHGHRRVAGQDPEVMDAESVQPV